MNHPMTAFDLPRIERNRYPSGTEYFLFPSRLAQQVWLCPSCFGQAQHAAGFCMGDQTKADYSRIRQGYLLHVILAGSFWHEVGGRTHVANSGEACLLDLSEQVAWGNRGPRPAKLLWVCFDGHHAARLFTELRADADPVYRGFSRPRMIALFEDLLRLGHAVPPAVEPEAAGILTLILAQLFAARGPMLRVTAPGAPDRILSDSVRRAIDYVSRRYHQIASVKTMAIETGLKPEQLSRIFRRELDMTPTEYLMRYRIEQAKRLLAETNKPVNQVAHAVGFPDANYFTRLFTKLSEQTPRRYRADHRP